MRIVLCMFACKLYREGKKSQDRAIAPKCKPYEDFIHVSKKDNAAWNYEPCQWKAKCEPVLWVIRPCLSGSACILAMTLLGTSHTHAHLCKHIQIRALRHVCTRHVCLHYTRVPSTHQVVPPGERERALCSS